MRSAGAIDRSAQHICAPKNPETHFGNGITEETMLERLEQQRSLTVNQWKIISAAILGDMLDFFDFFLIGYVLVFIVTQWKLTFIESGVILLAAGVGAIPGAFFWG